MRRAFVCLLMVAVAGCNSGRMEDTLGRPERHPVPAREDRHEPEWSADTRRHERGVTVTCAANGRAAARIGDGR